MRLAALMGLLFLICMAVVGGILSQRRPVSVASHAAAPATTGVGARAVVPSIPGGRAGPPVAAEKSRPVATAPVAPLTAAPTIPAPDSPAAAPVAPMAAAPPVPEAAPVPARRSPAVAAPVAPMAAAPPAPAEAATPAVPPTAEAPPPEVTPPVSRPSICPANPAALGVSRVIEIETKGGPGFGFGHDDVLREGEVVLTFDDGPWPKNTPAVLAALAAHCTKAIFFPIGLHATYEPELLKQVAAAGHAIGSHTWCHQDLSKTKGACVVNGRLASYEFDPKDEIEKGISAVHWAIGGPTAPYFRFPALGQPLDLIDYLGRRNIAIFSAEIDSLDFKMRKPEQVRQSVMAKLKKNGKGIVLMHDFLQVTAEATMGLLNDLKAGGYQVVFLTPKSPVTTIASYDEWTLKQMKSPISAPTIGE